MKRIISLLSILSLFTVAIACNQNDRQDEEVRGMGTTEERMDQTEDAGIERTEDHLEGTDQRMEDSFEEDQNQMNEGSEGRVEEGVTP